MCKNSRLIAFNIKHSAKFDPMKKLFDSLLKWIVKMRVVIVFVLLPLFSLVLHYKIFNLELQGTHAWRQTETQTIITNFAEKDMNIMNPRVNNHGIDSDIFRMEFPLMEWVYAVFFKVFGDHIIISRILTFITGLFCVFGFYRLGYVVTRDYLAAIIGAFAFSFSPSFYFYTMNPMPDIMALCFSIWGLVFFFKWFFGKRYKDIILCIVMFTLATLVKLPFILNFALIGVYEITLLVKSRFKQWKRTFNILLLSLLILSPAIAWYAWVIPGWKGNGIVQGIAGLTKADPAYLYDLFSYNFSTVFPKLLLNQYCLPLFIGGVALIFIRRFYKNILFPALVCWAVSACAFYLFEMNMIDKWHDYYLFPFLPIIFLTVLYAVNSLVKSRQIVPVTLVFALMILLPAQAKRFADYRWRIYPGNAFEMNPDFITCKKELRNAVPDTAHVIVANDISPFIDLYYIHKKGWWIDNYWLSEDTLIKRIKQGAQYFYCDTRKLDENPRIRRHLSGPVYQCNTIKVWKLKN